MLASPLTVFPFPSIACAIPDVIFLGIILAVIVKFAFLFLDIAIKTTGLDVCLLVSLKFLTPSAVATITEIAANPKKLIGILICHFSETYRWCQRRRIIGVRCPCCQEQRSDTG